MSDENQWQQFDSHDTQEFKLSESQQAALIAAWQQSSSFDDVIVEAQMAQGVIQ